MAVAVEDITRATIAGPTFVPSGAAGDVSASKIRWSTTSWSGPAPGGPCTRSRGASATFLRATQDQELCCSTRLPTAHWCTVSAGVFVEAKASKSRTEAHVQLGLWVAAWYKRV